MKISKRSLIIILVFITIVLGTREVYCQQKDKKVVGCEILNKDDKAIFITYEGLEENKGNGEWPQAILRLRNNTICPIFVETKEDVTQEAHKFSFTKEESSQPISYLETKYGRVKQEITVIDSESSEVRYTPEFSDDVILPVIYIINDYNSDSIKPGNTESLGGGCISYGYTVLPGQSVCFTVKMEHFQLGDILVSFEYEWERTKGFTYESLHRVWFDAESLPKNLMKQFNIKSRFEED